MVTVWWHSVPSQLEVGSTMLAIRFTGTLRWEPAQVVTLQFRVLDTTAQVPTVIKIFADVILELV